MAAFANNLDSPDTIDGISTEEQQCFAFEGVDILGANTSMYIWADDEDHANAALTKANIEVQSIKPRRLHLARGSTKLSREQLGTFAIQLAERTSGGDPIPKALSDIARSSNNPLLRTALGDVNNLINTESVHIHDAFDVRPDVFPDALRHIIRVGAKKGDPSDMLRKYGERQIITAQNISKVKGALIYPFVVLSFAGCIVLYLCYFILPKMEEMYTALLQNSNAKLPALTRLLLAFSRFLATWPGIASLVFAVIGIVVIVRWLSSKRGRLWIQRACLNWPIFGPLVRDFNAAYLIDLMSILAPVVNVQDLLMEAAAASLNIIYRETLEAVHQSMRDGALDLKTAVAPYAYLFGDEFQAAVSTGEETGRLANQFANYASLLDRRVQDSTAGLSKTVEPLALLVAGSIIGVLVIAIYWPLFSLAGSLANNGH